MLSKLGAFDNKTGTKVYTKNDLAELVEYAQLRGIEIVPEIDIPAHTYAWGKAFPEIISTKSF